MTDTGTRIGRRRVFIRIFLMSYFDPVSKLNKYILPNQQNSSMQGHVIGMQLNDVETAANIMPCFILPMPGNRMGARILNLMDKGLNKLPFNIVNTEVNVTLFAERIKNLCRAVKRIGEIRI